ncbi:carboxymuconolactone decarboxylase family protein [Mycetocola saprophilus]|uniref:carboxymuconolactone decarboxylase family protein n=1 Tax=Mycetocola saprophilus TaxID=76636 RepID=UPI003BEFF43F
MNDANIAPKLVELVKIRVSQLNGCAFCLRMHTRDAIALGGTSDRISVIAAWWESQYFTKEEQAALAIEESVTSSPSGYRMKTPPIFCRPISIQQSHSSQSL